MRVISLIPGRPGPLTQFAECTIVLVDQYNKADVY